MKSVKLLSIAIVTLVAASLPAQAQQRSYKEGAAPEAKAPEAVGDPLKRLYRISGVRDTGSGLNAGVATSFHCTSFSTVDETLQVSVRNFNGTVVVTRNITITPFRTLTLSTHGTLLFAEDSILSPGVIINQGSANILATDINIFCSAMIVDAATASPQGISLHMVRYNPVPGTQE
jgi:hypothetical protein